MKPMDNVGVTFVNALVGRGTLNNVVNLQFGTFQFTPSDDGTTVNPEMAVSCRLRMDRTCAQQLYEQLGVLLESIEKSEHEALSGAVSTVEADKKPN